MDRKKINEKKIKGKCLNCGNNELILRELDYKIPNFGKYYLFSIECPKCNFTYKDFYSKEKKEEKKMEIKLKDKESLNSIFVRSEDANIYLENLDLEIKPIEGEPLLTTFEGLLNKIEGIIKIMDNKEVLEKLRELRELKEPIIIKIEDKSGISKVIKKKGNIEIREMKK